MSTNYLQPSTDKQDDFSVGALPSNCIRQWVPDSWSKEGETTGGIPQVRVGWQGAFAGVRFSHSVSFNVQETDETQVIRLDQVIGRILCHFLVSRIPDEGLEELYESIWDILHFYKTGPQQRPSLPPFRREIRPYKANRVVRPVFSIHQE